MNIKLLRYALVALAFYLLSACSKLEDPSLDINTDNTEPETLVAKSSIAPNSDKSLFFGDLHIHTSLSSDAYILGVRSLPDDVYAFAKGNHIDHALGYSLKIDRPLDFVAVTDHAEYLGQARLADLDIPSTQQSLRDLLLEGNKFSVTKAWLITTNFIRENGFGFGVDKIDQTINDSAWKMIIDSAERHNEPGVFTAFIGYEWSAFAGDPTIHMHRNVIYRGNADNVSKKPFSSLDSQQPEDLWGFLDQENSGGRTAFAIPHNANLSNGKMYASVDSQGQTLTADYARQRNRNEPISEILQIKGSSETHPLLSNLDEFANFELTSLKIGGGEPEFDAVKGSYARDALRTGIELAHSEGFNPFRFGVIGSSDSHNANSPAQEENYTGKLPLMDGTAGLRTDVATLLPSGINPVPRWGSGGLAAVWAEENTRDSLYDSLINRETYATSGPRISLRFFAGWGYESDILDSPDFIQKAYAGGVPMGGTLESSKAISLAQQSQSPMFIVSAAKDPNGANLDRVQIVKAWIDSAENSQEQVFDIVLSDGREVDETNGKAPPVGNTVDIKTAKYSNSIGAATLSAIWTDPNFDPATEAFYYSRVIEIPTPRWSTFDAITLGTEPMEPATIQERAISSAIWINP